MIFGFKGLEVKRTPISISGRVVRFGSMGLYFNEYDITYVVVLESCQPVCVAVPYKLAAYMACTQLGDRVTLSLLPIGKNDNNKPGWRLLEVNNENLGAFEVFEASIQNPAK